MLSLMDTARSKPKATFLTARPIIFGPEGIIGAWRFLPRIGFGGRKIRESLSMKRATGQRSSPQAACPVEKQSSLPPRESIDILKLSKYLLAALLLVGGCVTKRIEITDYNGYIYRLKSPDVWKGEYRVETGIWQRISPPDPNNFYFCWESCRNHDKYMIFQKVPND